MRERIASMRKAFVEQMHSLQDKQDYSFLLSQRGMFSLQRLKSNASRSIEERTRNLHRRQRSNQRRRNDGRESGSSV